MMRALKEWLPVAAVAVLVACLFGRPVPFDNDWYYLLHLYNEWNPGYLVGDWAFSSAGPEHWVFNRIFGLPFLFLSLPAAAWLGRIFFWTVNLWALFRLGRRFSLPPAATALSLALWLALRQSLVGGEWVFGGFEAKCAAYALLFLSLDRFIGRRPLSGAVLLGLCFTFHPAVGMWAGLSLAMALPLCGYRGKDLVIAALAAGVCALPGAVPLLGVVTGAEGGSADDWKLLALVSMPQHFDPFSWNSRDMLTLYLMFLFNALHARLNRDHGAIRLLFLFQAGTAFFFTLGLALRYTESYDVLKYMPFRLFPVMAMLFFFMALAHAFLHLRGRIPGKAMAGAGLAALLGLENPFGTAVDDIRYTQWAWTRGKDDYRQSLDWIRENTPREAVFIMPPWRHENWYESGRGQVVSYVFISYDRLSEWRRRLESLVGEVGPGTVEEKYAAMERRYESLTAEEMLDRSREYGAGYLLTKADYPFPVSAAKGPWKVYSLPR